MLQITRETGEGIKIGTQVTLRLLKIESLQRIRMQLVNGDKTSAFTMELHEEVLIGPEVNMELMNINNLGQIRLGFQAPKTIIINREELTT